MDLVREAAHRLGARHVDATREHVAAELAGAALGLGEPGLVDVAQEEVGAAARDRERGRAPDAAAGARHQRGLAAQIAHLHRIA